jgi:hypothetical protein
MRRTGTREIDTPDEEVRIMGHNDDLVRALLAAAKGLADEARTTGSGGPAALAYAQGAQALVEAADLATKIPEPGL